MIDPSRNNYMPKEAATRRLPDAWTGLLSEKYRMSLKPADLTSPQESRLRQLVGEFENAWRRASSPGRGPDLRVFLPSPDDPLRRAALEELIKADLLERWQRL